MLKSKMANRAVLKRSTNKWSIDLTSRLDPLICYTALFSIFYFKSCYLFYIQAVSFFYRNSSSLILKFNTNNTS